MKLGVGEEKCFALCAMRDSVETAHFLYDLKTLGD
jgi:hypothetical protein